MNDRSKPAQRYTPELAREIETRCQDRWAREETFHAPNPAGPWAEPDAAATFDDHMLILDMFPYPSGAGLHVGHPLGYIATDVVARYNRMLGKNVLHCFGFDAFGLPAEQYAIQTGQHPRRTTDDSIAVISRQLRRLGLGHDNRRAIKTTDPGYYKWTQWIFLQIYNSWFDDKAERPDGGYGKARPIAELLAQFESGARGTPGGQPWPALTAAEQAAAVDAHRLAYPALAQVNWCPGLGTVLSNEEVTNEGRSERGNFPVFRKNLRQWMMRITAYAERLADDLDRVGWPEQVKVMQRNWIGRSEGVRLRFPVDAPAPDGQRPVIEVFTTRADTVSGATFLVLAPEHPLAAILTPDGGWPPATPDSWTCGYPAPGEAVRAYRATAARKSEMERQRDDKGKTGVFTGSYALNPVNRTRIPIFVADYVLMGYGSGAIMAVPAQDARDHDFALKFGLDIVDVVAGPAGLPVEGMGERAVSYRIRDWLFSRQRYWGEPFPIIWDQDGTAHAVPESMLPVELPDIPDYSPRTFGVEDADSSPEPPLSRAPGWVQAELDLGDGRGMRPFSRETNTMPNWAGSCWYYLRYLDPANAREFVAADVERYWMGPRAVPAVPGTRDPGGVDLYIGGVEHAVLHLLYARFWHKVLFDLGHVSSEEPFRTYFGQGMIEAPAFTDARGQYVPAAEVAEVVGPDGSSSFAWQGQPVNRVLGKIGKSRRNVIAPDDVCDSFGADTFRLYEMSLGPLDVAKPWDTRGIAGPHRFLQRLWRNLIDEETGAPTVTEAPLHEETARLLHRTIATVRSDYESLKFNTAFAALNVLNNALAKLNGGVPREAAEAIVLMIAPLAPHIAEELWSRLGHSGTLTRDPFPVADAAVLARDRVTCVIQVDGKVRDRLEVAADIGADELRALALSSEKVRAITSGQVKNVIVKPPRLANVVCA